MKIFIVFLVAFWTLSHSSALALEPDTTYIAHPDSLQVQLRWQDHKTTTSDGLSIALRHFEPLVANEFNEICIILVGSDKGNLSHYTLQAASLALAGFHVVCFDYRGFGRSQLYSLDRQYLYLDDFELDLAAAVAWSHRLPVKRRGLFAFSMGTITAQQYLWNHRLDFAAMDGMIVNPVTAAKQLDTIYELQSWERVLIPASGFHFEKKIKTIKTPLFIFAGKNDRITPVRDIYRFASKRKKFRNVIDYEGGHASALQELTKNYFGDIAVQHLCDLLRAKK